MRTGPRALPAALAALVLGLGLGACSGGDGGGGGDGDGGGTPTAAPTGPTGAEYEQAHTLYHDLSGVLDGVNAKATSYQNLVRRAWEKDPEEFRKDERVIRAVRKQRAVAARRDAALDALAAQPAMADQELATAYQAFRTGYAAGATYQDGFNDSFPVFLESGAVCQRIFGVQPPAGDSSTSEYAEEWLAEHEAAAAPCLKLSARLGKSANVDLVRLAARYRKLVDDRNAAITGLRDDRAGTDETVRALSKANKTFLRDYAAITRFSEKLATLVPVDLYQAVDPIFADRVGETAAPSPTAE